MTPMMDKPNANGFSSKPSENGERKRQLPYSVETPYGFHLDLDFLKYVDDIEKGNTIRRVHVHRRSRGPRFSTLPRNFSLPGHSCRPSPPVMWASTGALGPKASSAVSEDQQIFDFRACESRYLSRLPGVSCKTLKAMEDASIRAFDEQPLGFHVRPYLLRATSMPVTVLQRKCSETSDDQGPHSGDACWENGSAENIFCPADLEGRRGSLPLDCSSLSQQLANALQRIRELEDQVRTVAELKAQIGTLRKEKEHLLLRLDFPSAAITEQRRQDKPDAPDHAHTDSHPSTQEINKKTITQQHEPRQQATTAEGPSADVDMTDRESGSMSLDTSSDVDQLSVTALQAKLMTLQQKISQSNEDLEKSRALLREITVENKLKDERIKQLTQKECVKLANQNTGDFQEAKESPTHCPTVLKTHLENQASSDRGLSTNEESHRAMVQASTDVQHKHLTSSSTQTDIAMVFADPLATEKFAEALSTTSVSSMAQISPTNAGTARAPGGSVCPDEVDAEHPVSASAERASCSAEPKEHQDPRVGGGDRPAAAHVAMGHHINRIQELLQEQCECMRNVDPDATSILQPDSKISSIQAQLVSSAHTLSCLYTSSVQNRGANACAALKSIMKKDYAARLGNSGAKKNLKFVGVNGGYETTSSEESSDEDNVVECSLVPEIPEGHSPSAGSTHESNSPETPKGLHEEQSASRQVDEDFMAACHFLKDRVDKVVSPDNEMRHFLMKLYQEWFHISSQEDSLSDTVALYLRRVQADTPALLPFVANLADANDNTALHYSVSHSNFQIAKLLLDTGVCEVDHRNKAGYTATMLASLSSADALEDTEVARRLMELGDIDARATQAGQTALMLAAGHGRSAMTRLLLGCGADPNIQDHAGTTALMHACENGHAEIVRLLLEHNNCDTALTNNEGHSALSLASQASHSEIADLLRAHGDAGTSDSAAVL